jgi:hypothetical protein
MNWLADYSGAAAARPPIVLQNSGAFSHWGYPRICTGTGRFRTEKLRHPNHLAKTVDLCRGSHVSTKEWDQLENRKVEAVMNHSMHSADRATHLKVVVIGFMCAFFVLIVGLSAHVGQIDLEIGRAHV